MIYLLLYILYITNDMHYHNHICLNYFILFFIKHIKHKWPCTIGKKHLYLRDGSLSIGYEIRHDTNTKKYQNKDNTF